MQFSVTDHRRGNDYQNPASAVTGTHSNKQQLQILQELPRPDFRCLRHPGLWLRVEMLRISSILFRCPPIRMDFLEHTAHCLVSDIPCQSWALSPESGLGGAEKLENWLRKWPVILVATCDQLVCGPHASNIFYRKAGRVADFRETLMVQFRVVLLLVW